MLKVRNKLEVLEYPGRFAMIYFASSSFDLAYSQILLFQSSQFYCLAYRLILLFTPGGFLPNLFLTLIPRLQKMSLLWQELALLPLLFNVTFILLHTRQKLMHQFFAIRCLPLALTF